MGHITRLLDTTNPGAERDWYAAKTLENEWNQNILVHQIDTKLYERQQLAGKVSGMSRLQAQCLHVAVQRVHIRWHLLVC